MSSLKHCSALRFVFLILAVTAITIGLPAAKALACACCGTYSVSGVASWDTLNVRSGPGTGYQITQKLASDEGCITKTGERQGNWVRINAGGGSGWVNQKYLRYWSGPTATGPGNPCSGSWQVQGVASNDVLNMRTGPGTNYGIAGIFQPNDCGIRLSGRRSGNWVEVNSEQSSGWVNQSYLRYVR